jgi:6-pyruvoyltetrahydropterin/6-carboxytetrahydropterin synthase
MSDQLQFMAAAPFEAARHIDTMPAGHREARLHGHSFVASVRAALPASHASFDGAEADDLQQRVQTAVEPLGYSLLNDTVAVPSDENLARWLAAQLPFKAARISLQSTRDQGVDLDADGRAHRWRRYRFEAAHQLNNVPAGHQCGRMHGHGFEVMIHTEQAIDAEPIASYDDIDNAWQPLGQKLHLACLNDIAGLEIPTSELLASWIWQALRERLPHLSCVSTFETATSGCHYNGREHRIWKEQRFEAATLLPHAPAGDRRSHLHGHSYLSRLHLTAPLDTVMGWTVDYGDVKEMFSPIYRQLDHHNLATLEGPANGNLASIAQWARKRLSNTLPQLDRIDLLQAPGCGCALSWSERAATFAV